METMKLIPTIIASSLLISLGAGSSAFAEEVQITSTAIEVFETSFTRKGVLSPDNILDRKDFGSETALITSAQWEGLNLRIRVADEFDHHDGGWRNDGDFDIQELSYEFVVPDGYRLSLGKLSESWHVGYAFHPLGFFETELNRDDLSERFKRSEGLPTIVGGYLADSWDMTLTYSDDTLNTRDGFNRGLRQWGARLGMLSRSGLETSLVMQKPEHQKIGFGGSAVYVFGNSLEVHGSVFARQGTRRPLHKGIQNGELTIYTADPYEEARLKDDKWYARSLVGLQWTSDDQINVVLEWSHDRRGLNSNQWDQWKNMVNFHASSGSLGVSTAGVNGNLKYDAQTLLETGTRQDYIFMRVTKGGWDWTPEASVLFGVADASAIWSARLAYTAATDWDAEVFSQFSTGSSNSEFGISPNKGTLGAALRYHF